MAIGPLASENDSLQIFICDLRWLCETKWMRKLWFSVLMAAALTPPKQVEAVTKKINPPQCSPSDFKALSAASDGRPGAIPGFNLKFTPTSSMADLVSRRAQLIPGRSPVVLGESGSNKWFAENRHIAGHPKPEIVAVKYAKGDHDELLQYASQIIQEADALKFMNSNFKRLGLDRYFEVAVPLEVNHTSAAYPHFEAINFRELARSATSSVTAKPFKNTWDTGGPVSAAVNPIIASMWARHQEGMNAVAAAFKREGMEVKRDFGKSWTTGERYVTAIYVSGRVDGVFVTFNLRPDDVLVTTDGRFVITDPF